MSSLTRPALLELISVLLTDRFNSSELLTFTFTTVVVGETYILFIGRYTCYIDYKLLYDDLATVLDVYATHWLGNLAATEVEDLAVGLSSLHSIHAICNIVAEVNGKALDMSGIAGTVQLEISAVGTECEGRTSRDVIEPDAVTVCRGLWCSNLHIVAYSIPSSFQSYLTP